jgi:hypothetical protein
MAFDSDWKPKKVPIKPPSTALAETMMDGKKDQRFQMNKPTTAAEQHTAIAIADTCDIQS